MSRSDRQDVRRIPLLQNYFQGIGVARILVADDSLTIQKVVSITLSSLPYQLVQARAKRIKYILKDGCLTLCYLILAQLIKNQGMIWREIRKRGYKGYILTLVGTFDSINETTLQTLQIELHPQNPLNQINLFQNVRTYYLNLPV